MKRGIFSRDILLISFSAFFADLGYQGVTALFALLLIFQFHEPVYVYGIITAAAFGIGSFFAFLGGKAGDKYDRKTIAILGNLFIPLMSLSGLFINVWIGGLMFVMGWWARYFRTPARRALLVEVSPSDSRSKVFGFLHALDIGGGIFSALLALLLVLVLHLEIGTVILLSIIPLSISSVLLFFIKRDKTYIAKEPKEKVKDPKSKRNIRIQNKALFIALLVAATFYGFSFYNAGYPVITAAMSHSYYAMGLIAYAVYLGISAISGYLLGSFKLKPIRALWAFGYLPSAIASLLIGASIFFHLNLVAFYLFVALLGTGMGAVETFEPTATSFLVKSKSLSRGMGWLSVSRSLGQFISNLIMGIIFTFNQSWAYAYAFAASLVATIILAVADLRNRHKNK